MSIEYRTVGVRCLTVRTEKISRFAEQPKQTEELEQSGQRTDRTTRFVRTPNRPNSSYWVKNSNSEHDEHLLFGLWWNLAIWMFPIHVQDINIHFCKKVMLVIYYSGIPCFAYMMAELSNFINYQLVNVQKLVERITKTQENSLSPASIELWSHIENFLDRYRIGLSRFYILFLELRFLYHCQSLFLLSLKDGAFWNRFILVCLFTKVKILLNFQHLFRFQQLDSGIWSRWWNPHWCTQMLLEMNQVRSHLIQYTRLLNSQVLSWFCQYKP